MSQYFDRSDSASLPGIIREMSAEMVSSGRSVMVHVEGAMAPQLSCAGAQALGAFLDMAIELGRPVVPVRFVGGLPVAPVSDEIDFPWAWASRTSTSVFPSHPTICGHSIIATDAIV